MTNILQQPNFYIFTGGPGSGKTTVLNALKQQGFQVVAEVARKIIQEQNEIGGNATHTDDQVAFCQLMLTASIENYKNSQVLHHPVFFDRGIPGLVGYANMIGMQDQSNILSATANYRYNPTVFIFPPWIEIYHNDAERHQDFEEAILTYCNLKKSHIASGYQVIEVPKTTIANRVRFILSHIQQPPVSPATDE